MNKAKVLSDRNFREEVVEFNGYVFADFWSSWCPPCKMVEPLIDELAVELADKIKVVKINVDQNPKTSAKFNIAGVPTFLLLKNSEVIKREIGARSKQQLLKMIEGALSGS